MQKIENEIRKIAVETKKKIIKRNGNPLETEFYMICVFEMASFSYVRSFFWTRTLATSWNLHFIFDALPLKIVHHFSWFLT